MSKILLSILTPSIPSRVESHLQPLVRALDRQIGDRPVEHLVLIDNKRRSIGEKRNALVRLAAGRYTAFVDDDESVEDDYVDELLTAIKEHPHADCVVFDEIATIDGGEPGVVRCSVDYENTEFRPGVGATRKPWHWCAYAAHIAKSCVFSDCNYGEDAHWVQQAWPMVRHEVRIDKVLRRYDYRSDVTEAFP